MIEKIPVSSEVVLNQRGFQKNNMSYTVKHMKYINDYTIVKSVETIIMQDFLLVNNGDEVWPKDTCLELCDIKSDLELNAVIYLMNQIPTGSQVMISIKIDVKNSSQLTHSFAYQLCCNHSKGKELIGDPISFRFKVLENIQENLSVVIPNKSLISHERSSDGEKPHLKTLLGGSEIPKLGPVLNSNSILHDKEMKVFSSDKQAQMKSESINSLDKAANGL